MANNCLFEKHRVSGWQDQRDLRSVQRFASSFLYNCVTCFHVLGDPLTKQNTCNLELLRRLKSTEFSRDSSRVRQFNGKETNVSRTVSVLVIRELNDSDEMIGGFRCPFESWYTCPKLGLIASGETSGCLMFFWPCFMNWLYINYQLDALIIIYS